MTCTTKKGSHKGKPYTIYCLEFDGVVYEGHEPNVQTEQGLRAYLECVADEMEMKGETETLKAVREAFFKRKTHPGIPKDVLEAVRG